MAQMDLTQLENLANLTFDDFVALNAQEQNRADIYYTALALAAQDAGLDNVANYAELAKNVVNNTGLNGSVANEYTELIADANGIDFSIDTPEGRLNRLKMQYELMQEDLLSRQQNIQTGGTGELDFSDTNDIHETALDAIGLPPEAYSLNIPLSHLGETDPAKAQALFEQTLPGDSFADVISDGLLLGFGADINGNQKLLELMRDYGDQADWLYVASEALQNHLAENAASTSQEIIDKIQDFQDIVLGFPAGLNDLADWLDSFTLPELPTFTFPSWLDDLLADWGAAKNEGSPLVLDLDGNGIDLASVTGAGAVYWDIDEDGFAEKSGWIAGNDGLLAIDLNADGIINDHSELFGTQTTDGFTVLAAYDSNADNVIDANDTQFGDLLVWVDANADGVSQSGELQTLTALGITSINLNAALVDYDIAGNHITHESTFTINGQTQTIVDAWFAYDNTNSHYAQDYTLDVRTLYLPSLHGFGDVADLHIAMSLDETLLLMVKEVAVADAEERFSTAFDLQGKLEAIMYRWAGVDGVDPASRGSYIDARKLEFLEKYLGDDYLQQGTWSDPGSAPAELLEEIFDGAFSMISKQLLSQSGNFNYFDAAASYNFAAGAMEGGEAIDNFDILQPSDYIAATLDNDVYAISENSSGTVTIESDVNGGYDQIWVGTASTSDVRWWVESSGNLFFKYSNGASQQTQFNSAFISGDGADIVDRIEKIVFADGVSIDLSQGLELSDTDDAHNINGSYLDDVIKGRGGNDTISGWDGNDTLIGGLGVDYLYGNEGDDTYHWDAGDGNDRIFETIIGFDQISLEAGITADDVRLVRDNIDLLVHIGGETIEVTQHFYSQRYSGGEQYQVEQIVLDDQTVIDLLNNITFTGSGANETFEGTSGNDTFEGKGGSDYLYGYAGDDSYVWSVGDGNDRVYESGGSDRILLDAGITADDVRLVRVSSNDLKLVVGSEEVRISNQLYDLKYGTNNGYAVEQAEFADGTTIDLVNNLTLTGTDSNESISGLHDDNTLIGAGGRDYLYGYEGNDTLRGDEGDDRLYGGADDDTLHGGDGVDLLYGEAGADTFAFEASSAFTSSDNIQDFKLTDNDKLDIADLLIGYDPLTDAITDFVEITDSGSNSILSVDADGGADNFIQIATIKNAIGLTDEQSLETSGNLITA